MTEIIYGDEVKVYVDGVLVGTREREDDSIKITIPAEFFSGEGSHVISIEPVPIQEFKDPSNCEFIGTLKRESIHDSNEDIFNVDLDKWIIKRKREDNKEEKLPKKLRNGWG